MSKFELSLSRDYVGDWTYIEGIRELFQNALDQHTSVEGNDMFFEYDEDNEILRIGNKKSILDRSTLLLGTSSKRDDEETIGQFGEGYKIATLVLTREGHNVVFYNYGAREVWKPRFVKSRRYGADVLTFFVEKQKIWNKVPDNNLTIEISNITKEQYEKIKESNLHIETKGETIETEKGRILLDEEYKGKVFVNGLYVCEYGEYEKGYDFKPQYLKLDRDRKMVDTFELRWVASGMWSTTKEDVDDIFMELIEKGAGDVEYYNSTNTFEEEDQKSTRSNKAYWLFREEHGENAVPVTSTRELEKVRDGYRPVIVNNTFKETIVASEHYGIDEQIYIKSTKELLEEWIEKCKDKLDFEEVEEFYTLLNKVD